MKLNKLHKLLILLTVFGCCLLIYINYNNVNQDSFEPFNNLSSTEIQSLDESIDTPTESIDNKSKIEINNANIENFSKLKGIGPVIAGRIVDYRDRIGKFEIIEQLLDVQGIGEKLFDTIKPYIYVAE